MFFRLQFFGIFLFPSQYSLVYVAPISIPYPVCRCKFLAHGLYILEWRLKTFRQMPMFSFNPIPTQ